MIPPARRTERIWRTLALAGIVLTALNLRTAVVSISPIADDIGRDIALGSLGLGIIGSLPPVAFAVFALLTPAIVRRLGLEVTMVVSVVAMLLGHLGRALAPELISLSLASALVLVGSGVGNVLLPPLVRRYFPTRIGVLTSVVATLLAVSASASALIVAPVSTAAGWRVALGLWGVLALLALLPWLPFISPARRAAGEAIEEPQAALLSRMWRSRTAIALAIVFATSSLSAYSFFAWLPQILMERAGMGPVAAGAMLALYAFVGFPINLVVPLLTARMRNVAPIVFVGTAVFVVGYGGLLVAPGTATWLWVLLTGAGPLMFPLALVLIGLRTRTHEGTVALSGFIQGAGYGVAAVGPLLVGVLHALTGGYEAALAVLVVLSLPSIAAGIILGRPRYVEDEIADHER